MSNKMYVIVAVFYEDGGFGYGVATTRPEAVFTNKSEAEAYVELHEGDYRVVSVPLNPNKEVEEYESN